MVLLFGPGRLLTAIFLFASNIMAVESYPDLWRHGFLAGLIGSDFNDHRIRAMMLLGVIARGLARCRPRRADRPAQSHGMSDVAPKELESFWAWAPSYKAATAESIPAPHGIPLSEAPHAT